jgi:metal-responsive CopG/Arc/MetJ family transcriptional regulator
MKTAISVPDDVFLRVDRFARTRRLSRSAVFTAAAEEYVQKHRADDITQRLNAVYANEDSRLDPVLASMQSISLTREDWE